MLHDCMFHGFDLNPCKIHHFQQRMNEECAAQMIINQVIFSKFTPLQIYLPFRFELKQAATSICAIDIWSTKQNHNKNTTFFSLFRYRNNKLLYISLLRSLLFETILFGFIL